MSERPDTSSERERRRRAAARLADLSTIGLVFPVAMVLGYFIGGFIGGWLGAREVGQWIGGGIGIVSGFYNVYKVVLRLNAEEERAAASEQEGEG